LRDELDREAEFEQIGGATYISSLIDGVPRTDTIEHYVKILKRKSLARRMLNAGRQIQLLAIDEPDDDSLIPDCQKLFYEACEENQPSHFVPLHQAALEWLEEVEAAQNGKQGTGLKTGLYAIDDPLGGLQRQELTVIAGRPSQGKTTITLDAARRLGKQGNVGAYFSIEMGYKRIGERSLAGEAPMDTFEFRNQPRQSTFEEIERWRWAQDALLRLQDCGVYVCDDASVGPMSIRAKSRRLKREKGRLDFIVVDYLGLMDLRLRNNEKRYEALGEAARKLKLMSKELDCAVIVCAQLNRDVTRQTKPEPELHHLADSGDIEKHTDVVAFVYRTPADGSHDEKTWVKVGKNRNGPIGIKEVRYVRNEHRFENV
jgi:replicative DNA helicase